jgi:hypothetical protein
MNWITGVRVPAMARDFSLFHSVQIDFGAHGVSYLVGNGDKTAGA